MSKIKSKNSVPELLLRKALWRKGIRYNIHVKKMAGNPDILIKKFRLVIFVDGTFWHGYQWGKKKTRLKTNKSFWITKIERTIQRDLDNKMVLEALGYTVMRFWDHEIIKELDKCVNQIMLYLETVKLREIPDMEDCN